MVQRLDGLRGAASTPCDRFIRRNPAPVPATQMIQQDPMYVIRAMPDEGPVEADRRRSPRIRQPVVAEISPWTSNGAGPAFGVIVENYSTTGVGLRHAERLKVGAQYLLEIPRPGQGPLSAVFTVVRCDETVGGWFSVELAPDALLEVAVTAAARRQAPPDAPARDALRAALILFAFAAAAVAVTLRLL
jgi:hypothetical protein